MGGCFSFPDRATENPVNGQLHQPGTARRAQSLCQSICDFFMECFYSRWCTGGFGKSMVTATYNIPPNANQNPHNERLDPTNATQNPHNERSDPPNATQHPHNKRSDLLCELEKSLMEVTAAKWIEAKLTRELELTEVKSPNGAERNVVEGRKNDISLVKTRNPDNKKSDPLGETKTSLDQEKLSNAKLVTAATKEQENGASALNLNAGIGVEGSEVAGNGADDEGPSSAN